MRVLDEKFGIQNNQLVKRSTGEAIPEDEPLFILRGSDLLAYPTLFYYLTLCGRESCSKRQILLMNNQLEKFLDYLDAHPDLMKLPGSSMKTKLDDALAIVESRPVDR
jgi:hypothetical protein